MARKSNHPLSAPPFKDALSAPVIKPLTGHILIVSEGTETEPNYFREFDKQRNNVSVFDIKCVGTAMNTLQVVDKAIELRDNQKRKGIPFDSVWAVFDKDNFSDKAFNDAIDKAERNDIGCAWSNEAFELWFIYHFVNRTTAMSRRDHQEAITKHIQKHNPGFKYEKNQAGMRKLLNKYGDEEKAIRYAEQGAATYTDKRYSQHNPCTMVYKLVRQLRGEDTDFNKKLQTR